MKRDAGRSRRARQRVAGAVALASLLVIAVVAMHSLPGAAPAAAAPMPGMTPVAAMPSVTSLPSAPSVSVSRSMAGCDGHACVATRTDRPGAPLVLPVAMATAPRPGVGAVASGTACESRQVSRAPPREGPRSVLCVWRV